MSLGAFVNGLQQGYTFRRNMDNNREDRRIRDEDRGRRIEIEDETNANARVDRRRRLGREDEDDEWTGYERNRQRTLDGREDDLFEGNQDALDEADRATQGALGDEGDAVVLGSSRGFDPSTLSEREILARTLAAEAGGEGYDGMLAAGAVIDNRVRSGRYGEGLRGVIMRDGQFSAWNGVTGYADGEGALDMASMRADANAYRAADAILSGDYQDPTGGATHYYNDAVANPAWGEAQAGGNWTRIGNHLFGSADGRPGSGGASVSQARASTASPTQPAPLGARRPNTTRTATAAEPATLSTSLTPDAKPLAPTPMGARREAQREPVQIGTPGNFIPEMPRIAAPAAAPPVKVATLPASSVARVRARALQQAQMQAMRRPGAMGIRRMA